MLPPVPDVWMPAYRQRLLSSHDCRFYVDVLDLDENPVGSMQLLDGSLTFNPRTETARRTANLTLVDPDRILGITPGFTWENNDISLRHLFRVRHVMTLPGYGAVSVSTIVGTPTAAGAQGPTVTLDLADKGQLADTPIDGMTVFKGNSAINAIRAIMAAAGETRLRLPKSGRALSRNYSVGGDATPIKVVRRICRVEYDMEFLPGGDGYFFMRPQPTVPVADVGYVLDLPQGTADFTATKNRARVYGAKVVRKQGSSTVTTQAYSVTELVNADDNSPFSLTRGGVKRYLTTTQTDSDLTTTAQTAARAKSLLTKQGGPTEEVNVSIVPQYHFDNDDIVTAWDSSGGTRDIRLSTATFPYIGDESGSAIGFKKPVAVGLTKRPKSKIIRHTKRR